MPHAVYDLQEIRRAHPVADVIANAGVELRRSARRLVGLCPLHRDQTPSLVVYPDNESYFCFGCEAGGDVIDFICRLHRVGFREAVALLGADIRESAQARPVDPRPAQGARPPTAAERAALEAAVSLYQQQYGRSRRARAYMRGRAVDDKTASRLRVGYAHGGLAAHLQHRGLSLDASRRLGLLAGERDTLAGRVVIPDLDADGRATWLTARSLDGREPRYLNLRLPTPLLGLARARAAGARAVVVTEGPFDWLTASSWDLQAVALLGTHVSRSASHALRSFRRVYLALDADAAGHRATTRLISALGARAVVVPLPPGVHDLNELGCRRGGRDAFLRSLHDARTRQEQSWQKQIGRDHRARAA